MWFLYFVLVCLLLFILGVHWFQTFSYTAKLLNQFPTIWMPPIIGQPALFLNSPDRFVSGIRHVLDSWASTHSAWAAHYPTVHIVTADDAEIILSNSKYNDKAILYTFFKPWLLDGLLVSSGKKWQQRRKILTPAFHFNILRKFVNTFGEHCQDFVNKLEEKCGEEKTDIVPLVNQLTLANILETAMGTKLDTTKQAHKNYFRALQSVSGSFVKRVFSFWEYNDFIYSLLPAGRKLNKNIKTMHEFTKSVISERMKNFKMEDVEELSEDKEKDELSFGKSKKRLAMLDILISNKSRENNIDDTGIHEEVETFTFEGHDTTACAARIMLLTVANHPDVQEKVIDELNTIFGSSKRHPTYEDLQEMKYSEMVIKECLRLYPSVYVIGRHVKEDIPLTHHTVPAGSEVLIHIYSVHREAKYFPNPEKFDPDRFLPENCKDRNPYAYIPFSAGPRNCIGQRFAMLELKCILASVLRNFRMHPIDHASDLTWIASIVLETEGPMHIKFEKRN